MDCKTKEVETDRYGLNLEINTFAKKPLRVLIVEDDVSLKKVILRTLKMLHENVEVEWATSADQFFSKQHEYRQRNSKFFDLVLADIHMPGANSGFEVWNHFMMTDPEIPVVIMSALSECDFKKAIGENTSIHYVQKPLSLEKCAAVLDLCG